MLTRRSTARRPAPVRARSSAAAARDHRWWSRCPSAFDVGHHLPDRLEHVGGRAEFEGCGARTRPTGRSDAHRVRATSGRRRRPASVMLAGLADARDLVDRLDQLRRADHRGGIHRRARGNSALPARRIAPVISSTATVAPAGTRSASIFAKCCDALVEFEVQRPVQMVRGHLRLGRPHPRGTAGTGADAHRRPARSRPAARRATARRRPAASWRRWRTRRCRCPAASTRQRPCSAIAARSRAPTSRCIRAKSGSVGMSRQR